MSNRLLVATQDIQGEIQHKLQSTTLLLEEKNEKLKTQLTKNSEQLEEILELKAYQEELQRKNKTLQMLYENSEGERLQLMQNHSKEVALLNSLFSEAKESLLMALEELRVIANLNLQRFYKKTSDYDELTEKHNNLLNLQAQTAEKLEESTRLWNRKSVYIEEIEAYLINKLRELSDLEENFECLNEKHEKLNLEHTHFVSLIPEELKEVEDPFAVLTGKISELSEILQEIEFLKSNMFDFEAQYDEIIIKFDENTQTDIGFSFFEKPRRISTSTPHSGSQRMYSAKSKDAPATIAEFPQRKKDSSQPHGSDSLVREETPVNLSGIYNQ